MGLVRIDIAVFIDDERPRPVGQQIVHEQHRSKDGRGNAGAEKRVDSARIVAISMGFSRLIRNPSRCVPDETVETGLQRCRTEFGDKLRTIAGRLQGMGVENRVGTFQRRYECRFVGKINDPGFIRDVAAAEVRIFTARKRPDLVPGRGQLSHLCQSLPSGCTYYGYQCHYFLS